MKSCVFVPRAIPPELWHDGLGRPSYRLVGKKRPGIPAGLVHSAWDARTIEPALLGF
jgi:hypothetical protein